MNEVKSAEFPGQPGGSSSVVERLLAKEEVASSNLVFRSTCDWRAGVAEQADAAVSKTVGGQPPCRFEPDLRQFRVPSCVVVAQRTLDPFAQVRILARQPATQSSADHANPGVLVPRGLLA